MKEVIIVGAGPAGLAIASCLNVLNIPNIVLEKEGCYAHLWKKKVYDRLKLHLAKEFCALPHMPHADSAPTYIPKDDFIRYLDEYVVKFNVNPVYNTLVESATYDGVAKAWSVKTRNVVTGKGEYVARFLVVATGENAQCFISDLPGLKSFNGDVVHSSQYKSGKSYNGKTVLVVGCGNSGMEIAYDLSEFGAKTSLAIRSPVSILLKKR